MTRPIMFGRDTCKAHQTSPICEVSTGCRQTLSLKTQEQLVTWWTMLLLQ